LTAGIDGLCASTRDGEDVATIRRLDLLFWE